MKYLEYIKSRKDFFFHLYYFTEKDTNQKKKYMHFYEAYYMLYQEIINLQINNKFEKNENEQI
jgi:hypothetical protein